MKATLLATTAVLALALPASAKSTCPIKGLSWGMAESKIAPTGFKRSTTQISNMLVFNSGRIAGEDAVLYCKLTASSRRLYSVVVAFGLGDEFSGIYFPFYRAISRFDRLHQLLVGKYGEPDSTYDFFSSPYERGDGYEDQALANEKYSRSSYWTRDGRDLHISLALVSKGWTSLSYEDPALTTKATEEETRANSDEI